MNDLASVMRDVRATSENITKAETESRREIAALRHEFESGLNDLWKRTTRPGSEGGYGETFERKDAAEFACVKHALAHPRADGLAPEYSPSYDEINEALSARKALKALFRHGAPDKLDVQERKSLTSFSFGANSFLLAPQMSNQILSCLIEPGDLSALVNNVSTSSGSMKFFIDNARMDTASWACTSNCFANNPGPDLQDGLGELEIKIESLRFIACAQRELLEDASFDVEGWLLRKVSDGFRRAVNEAIIGGDGVGKPSGLLNPMSMIPVCETGELTPVGQFTWQDLILLKYNLPAQWHANGAFVMNQKTLSLLITMSDANGRPLLPQMPQQRPGFFIDGSPIVVVPYMPDVGPGALAVAFGDWKRAYTLVNRRATTMIADPYSVGWCTLFKFDCRLGGAVTCGNAARLLRIR